MMDHHTWTPPLSDATFVGRRKRFFADVLVKGQPVTAHCPNTGSMRGLLHPGGACRIAWSADPRRKLPATLVQVADGDAWALVDTSVPNRVVAAAIAAGDVPGLQGYLTLSRERPWEGRSRVDLLLRDPVRPPCWVEVKNVTWVEGAEARFPDAVTARGTRHVEALAACAARGERAVLFLHVGHTGARVVRPADEGRMRRP